MTSRKHGTKPNLKAQQRNAAKRSPQAHAPESARYRRSLDWLTDGAPEHKLYRQENVDIFPAAPRPAGYSREELIRDKAREDARTIDGEDI